MPHDDRWREVTLCPATGWEAVFRGSDGEEFATPIACWVIQANVADPTETRVVGFDDHGGYLDSCEEDSHFVRYQPSVPIEEPAHE